MRRRIAREHVPLERLLERLTQNTVHVNDSLRREAADAVPSSRRQSLGVSSRNLLRTELGQGRGPQERNLARIIRLELADVA